MDIAARDALREHLCRQHADGRSWRVQCREDYGSAFSHTVLQKIAVLGVYPKDREILKALGLVTVKQKTPLEIAVATMARKTRGAVINHKLPKEEYDHVE